MLSSLTSIAEDAVTQAGYWGLAVIMAVETLFPPIPSELVLPLAGYEVSKGQFTFLLALLATTAGATIGSLGLYALARFGGRPAILRFRRVLRVSEADLDKADAWFDARGTKIVFFGRMVPGARSLVCIPAGLSEMPLRTYVAVTVAGSGLWNAALLAIGVTIGSEYERVGEYVGPASRVVVVLAVIGLVAGSVWLLRRTRSAPLEA